MMICPQTKAECKAKYCQRRNVCWDEKFPTPPKPTMAEFERLVDAYGEAMQSLCHFDECGTGYGRPELEVGRDAARADLIDFARRMGVE